MGLGVVSFIGQGLSQTVYCLLQRKPLKIYSPLSLTAWAYAVASCFMGASAVISLSYERDQDPELWKITGAAWIPILYWVFLGSVVGYTTMAYANGHLPASVVSSFVSLQPVVGFLLSFILLGETPALNDIGGIFIILGLLIIAKNEDDAPKVEYDHVEDIRSESLVDVTTT